MRGLNGPTLEERLICTLLHLAYYPKERVAYLALAEGHCVDMQGAVELVTGIDPKAQLIKTFSGNKPDTTYFRNGDVWEAVVGMEKP